MVMDHLKRVIKQFVSEREWNRFHLDVPKLQVWMMVHEHSVCRLVVAGFSRDLCTVEHMVPIL
jgi:hypothetical protein